MANRPVDTPAGDLLATAMRGDREAMAVFIQRYGPLIRRRYRYKLTWPARRVFDSEDLLSTIADALDHYIRSGRFNVHRAEQLWALIFRIGDRAVARQIALANRLPRCDLSSAALEELEARPEPEAHPDRIGPVAPVPSDVDRELLSFWLRGLSLAAIARRQGMPPGSIRKRWERLRALLRAAARRRES